MFTDPLEALFRGQPAARVLFQLVEDTVLALGDVSVSVARTQVAFAGQRQFAWVWLPIHDSRARPPGSIVLSFAAERRVDDARIVEVVEPYPGRWMHHVLLTEPADFDEVVRSWLAEAFAYGQAERRRRKRPGD